MGKGLLKLRDFMSGETIFLVDDISDNLEVLEAVLRFANYHVVTARSGEQALEILSAGLEPDLIGLDIIMPEMDGFQLAEQIRAKESLKNTPIVFFSANHNRSELDHAQQLGAADYIGKPYEIQDVLLRVKRVLESSKLQPMR